MTVLPSNRQSGQASLEFVVTIPAYAIVVLCFGAILFNYFIRNRADYLLHEALVCQISADTSSAKANCQDQVHLELSQLPGRPQVDLNWNFSSQEAEAQLQLTYQVNIASGFEWHIKIDREIDLPLSITNGEDT